MKALLAQDTHSPATQWIYIDYSYTAIPGTRGARSRAKRHTRMSTSIMASEAWGPI